MTFDPIAALAEARANAPDRPGPKLSFPEMCGLYAARENRIEILAEAFGVSRATVSAIANCMKPGKQKYQPLAREWRRLGEAAFSHAYYTEDIHARIVRLKNNRAEAGDTRKRLGPNPNANTDAGMREIKGAKFLIEWRDGWFFMPCNRDGEPIDQWRGRDGAVDGEPFRTSTAAYNSIVEDMR